MNKANMNKTSITIHSLWRLAVVLVAAFAIVVCAFVQPASVFADEGDAAAGVGAGASQGGMSPTGAWVAFNDIDTNARASLTQTYRVAETDTADALVGVQVRIYQVASFSLGFPLVGDFAASGISWVSDDGTPNYEGAAAALAAYAINEGVAPTTQGQTDADGQVVLADLPVGIYLVVADAFTSAGNVHYIYEPNIVSLPTAQEEGGLVYDVSAEVTKYTANVLPAEPQPVRYKVSKQWVGDTGYEGERPETVTVKLVCDGNTEQALEVQLSNASNWTYEWEGESGQTWTATEVAEVPHYSWSVEQVAGSAGTSLVIYNIGDSEYFNPPPDGSNNPPDGTTPPPDGSTPPGDNTPPPGGSTPFARTFGSLATKTGDVWWPVAPLVCLGLASLGLGLFARKHSVAESA